MDRPRSRCRRRRCREAQQPPPQPADSAISPAVTIDQRVLTVEGEGCRLWNHVLFGTNTCLRMIAGYAAAGMPGDPLPELYLMQARISKIIKSLE